MTADLLLTPGEEGALFSDIGLVTVLHQKKQQQQQQQQQQNGKMETDNDAENYIVQKQTGNNDTENDDSVEKYQGQQRKRECS